MIELLFIFGAFGLAIGFGVWCKIGLDLYFDSIAKIDERYTDD